MSSDDGDTDSEAMFRRVQRIPTIGDSDDDDEIEEGDDDPENEFGTLKQIAALACKRIDIGTAILPKPLFSHDVEDLPNGTTTGEIASNHIPRNAVQPKLNTSEDTEYAVVSDAPTMYAKMIQQEFNAVVIEHHLKWAPLVHSEPGPLTAGIPSERFGRYDFYHADSIVDWCIQNGITKIKGHVLVWHVTTPKFVEDLEPSVVREQLKRHIFTCMGHFKGRIKTWDVVNEALAPDGTLAENVFFRKLGPSYIEECFRWAHEADPNAILLYNDNKVEGISTPKSDGFYELLADLKGKNVPIHGCGIQAHFNAAGTGVNRPPTPSSVKRQIRRLGSLGLTVNISEMDVRVSKLPPDQGLRDTAQRQIYHDILAAALSESCFDGIWLWGFTDRHTWVHSFYYDDEPCILDESYQRKEAYYGVRDALRSLTPGNKVGGGVVLDADFDADGNAWGHQWMQPDDEEDDNVGNGGIRIGDARPDWEQQPSSVVDLEADINIDPLASTDSDYLPPIL
jgi:GH35 family endo-1,4-beta-xylanase